MYLTKKELAKFLNISVSLVNKLMTQKMPYVKIGKSVRFDPNLVVEWIKQRGGNNESIL